MFRALLTRQQLPRQFSSTSFVYLHPRPGSSSDLTKSPNQEQIQSSSPALEPTQLPIDEPPETSSAHTDLNGFKRNVREWTNQVAISFRSHADDFTERSKKTFSQLGDQLNKVTGYEAIESLKQGVIEQEARISTTRQAARQAKQAYDEAVVRRSNSQRKVNDLLLRKSTWTEEDANWFTVLVRQDNSYEQEETQAKIRVNEMDNTVDREFSQLMRSILARYHEEQVWSDKIRSASTYGSLAALGLNMLVFILAIVVVEPWKRQRLAQTFEKKVEELSQANEAKIGASMKEIGRQLSEQEALILHLRDTSQAATFGANQAPRQIKVTPEYIRTEDVETVNKLNLRWGTVELVGFATGAFVTGVLGCLWLAR